MNLMKRKRKKEYVVYADTTVEEKNITFPADAKLHKKIIGRCNKIANKEEIKLRKRYKKHNIFLQKQHNRTHPKRKYQALLVAKKLKQIATRIVRGLESSQLQYEKLLPQ